ncbi:MAG: cytochrome c biogenesis protein CcsA [Verrucomicrobia bacterium]|nr:cytochrome c biogenesis protein CcsA [Verrucomicrobiota bacterium]
MVFKIVIGLLSIYLFAGFLFFIKNLKKAADHLFSLAVMLHTGFLVGYSFFQGRPPVATMQETFMYVAWIVGGSIFFLKKQYAYLVPLGAFSSAFLLWIATSLTPATSELQPVLNAPYWLTVHVMVIVASYGFLLISALVSHIYLVNRKESLMKLIVPCNYIGTGLLTAGTILGGLWAARTWGSFWSWDVKESWAFISICIYLAALHMDSFKMAKSVAICLISSVGFLSVTFTWYGINYVLKKGMHTYGFGDGGILYYFIFLIADLALLAFLSFRKVAVS